jgi:hypothetical protein
MIVEQVSGSAWAECPNGVESAHEVDVRCSNVEKLVQGKALFHVVSCGRGEARWDLE